MYTILSRIALPIRTCKLVISLIEVFEVFLQSLGTWWISIVRVLVFFLPLLYVGDQPHKWVLSLGLSEFRSLHQVEWNLTMAATLLVMAPVIILFFLAQKAFVEGVTLTGVKG